MKFFSNYEKKLDQCREKFMTLGVDTLTSNSMSYEEREDLILQIEESLEEYFQDAVKEKKDLIQRACLKIKSDYPDFKAQVEILELKLIDYLNEKEIIDVTLFDDLMDSIYWEYKITPDDAEQMLKNLRSENKTLSTQEYKKLMAKIAIKYEPELLNELNSINPDDIPLWIEQTKRNGKAISNKVYAKAMAIKNGEQWLDDDQFESKK